STQDLTKAKAVEISFIAGLIYYAICATWVRLRGVELGVRPNWGRATAKRGILEGIVTGGVIAILLTAVTRLAAGRPLLDPNNTFLASSSLGLLAFGFVLLAVAAPLVEEIVFRGFMLEAFRRWGKVAALCASAAAFSLAHLRLSLFWYFFCAG